MPLLNSTTHYGTVTRFFHWAVFLLFAYQYVVANIMTRIEQGKQTPDQSWQHTFTEPGDFPYACTFHPDMKADVVVK